MVIRGLASGIVGSFVSSASHSGTVQKFKSAVVDKIRRVAYSDPQSTDVFVGQERGREIMPGKFIARRPESIIAQRSKEIAQRGLMQHPQPDIDELSAVAGLESLFHVLDQPLLVNHPVIKGLKVYLNELVGPRLSYLVCIGDYEQNDIDILDKFLKTGDKVVEMGGGIGLTAAYSAIKTGNPVVVIEPDSRLHPLIAKQVEVNGGEAVLVEKCVVANAGEISTVEFGLASEIWFSSMDSARSEDEVGQKIVQRINVETIGLNDALASFKPTVLVVDIEGAELGLFSGKMENKPRAIMIEIHTPNFGGAGTGSVITDLIRQGYKMTDQQGWTYLFELEE